MSPIYVDIRKAIEQGPKTRYRLAKETGISESQLAKFMRGTVGLSVEALERLAECLGHAVVLRPADKKE